MASSADAARGACSRHRRARSWSKSTFGRSSSCCSESSAKQFPPIRRMHTRRKIAFQRHRAVPALSHGGRGGGAVGSGRRSCRRISRPINWRITSPRFRSPRWGLARHLARARSMWHGRRWRFCHRSTCCQLNRNSRRAAWHFGACGGRRRSRASSPSARSFAGSCPRGRSKTGESPEMAALREVREEAGIEASSSLNRST